MSMAIVALGYAGTVSLTSSDPSAVMPSNYTFSAADLGQHSFAVTLDSSGAQSITATDTATLGLTATESAIMVQAGAANTLTIAGLPSTITAGLAYYMMVTARDAYGNVATGYTVTVSLFQQRSASGVKPASYAFTSTDAGQAYASPSRSRSSGTQSITASDTASSCLTATDPGIAVQAAAAKSIKIAELPAAVAAGCANLLMVTAHDAYGNMATGYTGTISFSSSDARALLPSNYLFTAADLGTHTFSVALLTAGTQSITATDTASGSITGTESDIVVRATPRITWSTPTSIVFGTPLGNAQLDAAAKVPGTFTYAPAAGAILNAGKRPNAVGDILTIKCNRLHKDHGDHLDHRQQGRTDRRTDLVRYFGGLWTTRQFDRHGGKHRRRLDRYGHLLRRHHTL